MVSQFKLQDPRQALIALQQQYRQHAYDGMQGPGMETAAAGIADAQDDVLLDQARQSGSPFSVAKTIHQQAHGKNVGGATGWRAFKAAEGTMAPPNRRLRAPMGSAFSALQNITPWSQG